MFGIGETMKELRRMEEADAERDKILTSTDNIVYGKRNKKDKEQLEILRKADAIRMEQMKKEHNPIALAWKMDTIKNNVHKHWYPIKHKYPYVKDHSWCRLFGRQWVPSQVFTPFDTTYYPELERAWNIIQKIESGEINPEDY